MRNLTDSRLVKIKIKKNFFYLKEGGKRREMKVVKNK